MQKYGNKQDFEQIDKQPFDLMGRKRRNKIQIEWR